MIKHQLFYVLLFAVISLAGCEKPDVQPQFPSEDPGLAAFGPANPCGAAQGFSLKKYVLGTSLGEAVLQNDSLELYLSFPLNQGWVMTEMYLYIGPRGDVPVDESGDAAIEEFPYITVLSHPLNTYTYKVPLGDVSACDEYVVLLKAAQIDQFGTLYNHTELIFDGSTILDLEWVSHCLSIC